MANSINIGGGANGGGSNVVPNPQGTATDTLTKIGINGTIYDFAGGGSGGSSYSETTLWSGSETPSSSGTQITLSDNISNYDEIVFVLDTDYGGSNSFLVSQLEIGEDYIATIYTPNNYGAYWTYDSDTQITIKSQSNSSLETYIKVVGIKYGGSGGHNYSTTEQVVGTWIDGSTVYEKTINVGTITTNTTVAHGIDNLDTIIDYSGFGKYAGTDKTVMPFQDPASSYGFGINTYDGTNLVVAKANSLGSNMSDCYITLRYTKSST